MAISQIKTGIRSKRVSSYDKTGNNNDRFEAIKPGDQCGSEGPCSRTVLELGVIAVDRHPHGIRQCVRPAQSQIGCRGQRIESTVDKGRRVGVRARRARGAAGGLGWGRFPGR